MADFFKNFPTVNYPLDGYGSDVANILTAVLPQNINVDATYVYQKFTVPAGMTAMALADQLYKDATKEWVFYLVNDMINPYTDWPMDDDTLFEFVTLKYDGEDPYETIHHFIDVRTNRYLDDVDDAHYRTIDPGSYPDYVRPISNWEYESDLNTARRDIIVINPKYISNFEDSFNKAIAGQAQ